MNKIYMVEFDLPEIFTEEMAALIPRQREAINQLMLDGIVQSYSLSLDRSRLWAVMRSESEYELMEYIASFPMADYLTPNYEELMFHNTASAVMRFSLN